MDFKCIEIKGNKIGHFIHFLPFDVELLRRESGTKGIIRKNKFWKIVLFEVSGI